MRVHVTTELDAMRGIVSAMESLCDDEGARRRVMRWVVDRYGRDVATVTPVGITLPDQVKERPSWDREPSERPDRRKQEPCRCGRLTIFGGIARLGDDGSRHTSHGCLPPPEMEVACPHESWEADSSGKPTKCADCGAILPDTWRFPVDTSTDGHEEDQSRE